MDELVDLERFVGLNDGVAEEAFARMTPRISRFLNSHLANMLPRAEDREDVIQTTLGRLWQRRSSFQLKGKSAWWAYVAITGRRCALTLLGLPDDAPLDDDVPATEQFVVDTFAEWADEKGRMYRAADELWLCIPPELTEAERRERLLAAQLFYIDGLPWEEVAATIGLDPKASRTRMDEWLSSESTLLELTFSQLFWDNEALAGYLLRPDSPLTTDELNEWTARVESSIEGSLPDGRTLEEAAILIWRFRYAMITEKILQRAGHIPRERIEAVLAVAKKSIPCKSIAEKLQETFAASWVRSMPLENPDLWKRLVFQYFAQCELPQKQILERTQPAAEVAGRKLTDGMLNVWLSNGRIFAQLANYAQEVRA